MTLAVVRAGLAATGVAVEAGMGRWTGAYAGAAQANSVVSGAPSASCLDAGGRR
jgi:hypothetical protein